MIRYSAFAIIVAGAVAVSVLSVVAQGWLLVPGLVLWALAAVGVFDLLQTRHSILRNYPIIGHIRWVMEGLRPELHQYFVESDTDEGGLTEYHLRHGGDLVWEIGSGYFGCRDKEGRFDPQVFADKAAQPNVKCVSIKLSQGAKPGLGGVMPAAKVTQEIADIRGVPVGDKCVSPSSHTAFGTPSELVAFIAQLRKLCEGKPVGFKLCIGHRSDFLAICKAMLETGVTPDFIIVDGGEGGTGAAPLEFEDHVGTPLTDGLIFVHNALVVADKAIRVRQFHAETVASANRIIAAIGLDSPSQLTPAMLHRRINMHTVKTYAELYPSLASGQLLSDPPPQWTAHWNAANAKRFGLC